MAPKRKPEFRVRTVLVIQFDTTSLFLPGHGSVAEIDYDITILRNSLLLYPRSHSNFITRVYNLALLQWARYHLSQTKDDLDKAIAQFTEVIFLLPDSRRTVRLLFRLAYALLDRSEKFKQLDSLNSSIEYLRYLRGLPLDFSDDAPGDLITPLLIRALSIQVKSEAATGSRDGTRNIKEMVDLCRELLTSDLPVVPFISLSLKDAVMAEICEGRLESLDQVIGCLRDAVKIHSPESHGVWFPLVMTLLLRFVVTHSNDDYKEAMALIEGVLDPNQPGECPDSVRGHATIFAAQFAHARSVIFQNPEYSQVAISYLRASLSLSSPFLDERFRLQFTENLAMEDRNRFKHYSLPESLEEADSNTSRLVEFSSSQSLEVSGVPILEEDTARESHSTMKMEEKIQRLEELLSITAPGISHYWEYLRQLAEWYKTKFCRTNDISDVETSVEKSINYCRLSLDATPGIFKHIPLRSLLPILLLAFKKTRMVNYLDESITVSYEILELKAAQFNHFRIIRRLVSSLLTRWQLLGRGRREDPYEAIRLMSLAINDQYAQGPDRFRLSCQWARLAREIGHPSALTAYKTAMSSIKKSLSFAPTLSIQHAQLVAMDEKCQDVAFDYASFQIGLGRFEEAIETLEQGRALLWSEMRGLRTQIMAQEDSPLAKRFAEINQELEALTISTTPSGRPEMGDGTARDRDWMDPFGRLVVKQRKLVEERDALILQIQGRPGSEGLLKDPSFHTLRTAASRGPVILINHCGWRSDILIIFHNSPPCSIPTITDFYNRAKKLRDKLVKARKHGLDSCEYQDALSSVLKGLYELVGEPVIKRLRLLGVPEQSRIWWCPTSVFCSLPLHAMGPIPSGGTWDSERYFSDLYIPSYTPSLSALIESRKSSPQTLEKPSLLLVAQPDDSLPGVNTEIKVIQRALKARAMVTDFISREATPTSVVEGLRGSHFAHFACHGVLETGKPFEASFQLHGGSRLTLLDIIRSRLPDAKFAFLACCHATEITEDSVADEALHLTAAMQYCGFRSVVGTMWEMADIDGQHLAKSFYKSLFSSQETGTPYYERSAGALRDATQKLRGKRGITLERWVNFVHYGA
ncbi:CHAT domain-containing protein [Lactarius deliciosus]|nr:CHAT domain-containing protein [Lactarius deliciosus]